MRTNWSTIAGEVGVTGDVGEENGFVFEVKDFFIVGVGIFSGSTESGFVVVDSPFDNLGLVVDVAVLSVAVRILSALSELESFCEEISAGMPRPTIKRIEAATAKIEFV